MDLTVSVARLEHLAQILTAAEQVREGGGLRKICSCCSRKRSECRYVAGSVGLATTDGRTQQEGLGLTQTRIGSSDLIPVYKTHTGMQALCQYYNIDPEQCQYIFDRNGYVDDKECNLHKVIQHVRKVQMDQLQRISTLGARLFKRKRRTVKQADMTSAQPKSLDLDNED